jgi:hypothetical protein
MAIALAATLAIGPAADARNRRKPDLVERQLGNPPAQLAAGNSFMVNDAVLNRGGSRAEASMTRYYLVAGRTVLAIGSRRVPALTRHHGSRGRVRLSIPARALRGRYSLLACVDANRRVAEANEQNNCRSSRRGVVVPGPGGVIPPPSPPPPMTSADSDGDGFPDAVDCAPHDSSVHPGATDVPDPGSVDSNCDGIDGDPADAVFVSPAGNDANPGTMSRPLRTLEAAIRAAQTQSKDVYAALGTYAEALNIMPGVSVYGGYGPSWQRTLSSVTRITGATNSLGDTEGALALDVMTPTTLQLLTIAPVSPTVSGASSYGLIGYHSPGLRLEHVTVAAAPGIPGGGGADGSAGEPGGKGGPGGLTLTPGKAGSSPIGHPGGAGGQGSNGHGAGAGAAGQSIDFDAHNRMGGPGGSGGQDGGHGTAGGRGSDGDSGVFLGDGAGAKAGNTAVGVGVWVGRDGEDGAPGSDGHGGGGGGGGGGSGDGYGGGGGGGGGGGQGGGAGRAGKHGGGSFGIFFVASAGAVVRDSFINAADGGPGGNGGRGAFGGAGGAGGTGGDGFFGSNSGGDGGRGGDGWRGGDGGGGAGGPSAAVIGIAPSDTPGTILRHGLGGAGGAGRGADGPAADFFTDGP